MALKQTLEEVNLKNNPELTNKLNEGFNKDLQKFMDSELMKQKRDIVVNEKGETLYQVFSRNLNSILDEFEQKSLPN